MDSSENIISVSEAVKIIQDRTEDFGGEKVPFIDSLGRVLTEDIKADRDFPAYDNVRMDGIAISYNAIEKGVTSFKIEAVQAAGSPKLELQNTENCIEVMTGSILPKNTDTIIQYEWLKINDGIAHLNFESFDKTKLIRNINFQEKGKEKKAGDILIPKGKLISSAEIGVLATVGKEDALVKKRPSILIISTGDELVKVSETPKEHQIRRSNVWSMFAVLKANNIVAETRHLTDNKEELKTKIKDYLTKYDVLMFSGAVSKGKFDFLPEILNELGVEKCFHKVKQRPGKPFWFGKKGNKTVFAFPGNPVSTYVGCLKYFLPWYHKSLGIKTETEYAVLAQDFSFKPNLHYFLSVQLEASKNEILNAIQQKGKGSGDLSNLVNVDAFLELPDDKIDFKKGEVFPVIRFRR